MGALGGLSISLMGFLIFIGYILCLVNAAKTGKWIWFILMLLIQPLFVLYFFAGYDSTVSGNYIRRRTQAQENEIWRLRAEVEELKHSSSNQ
jgi:hypothetical protein